jgi:hypothetical protein
MDKMSGMDMDKPKDSMEMNHSKMEGMKKDDSKMSGMDMTRKILWQWVK